ERRRLLRRHRRGPVALLPQAAALSRGGGGVRGGQPREPRPPALRRRRRLPDGQRPPRVPQERLLRGLLSGPAPQTRGVEAVAEQADGRVALTPEFRAALRYRDLLETKLAYTEFVLPDFSELFTAAVRSPETFFRQSRTFRLFAYDRASGEGAEDYAATRRW